MYGISRRVRLVHLRETKLRPAPRLPIHPYRILSKNNFRKRCEGINFWMTTSGQHGTEKNEKYVYTHKMSGKVIPISRQRNSKSTHIFELRKKRCFHGFFKAGLGLSYLSSSSYTSLHKNSFNYRMIRLPLV